MIDRRSIVGVVLAGGLSRRMGGNDKALIELGGRTLVENAAMRLAHQVCDVIINANGDPARFAFLDLPVQADIVTGFAGPLAGIHAALCWARSHSPSATHVLSVAADTPFFPDDLGERLASESANGQKIVLAASGGNRHPVFGLWPVALVDDLRAFLDLGETGKVLAFVDRHPWAIAEFEIVKRPTLSIDPFFNVNNAGELDHARRVLEEGAFGQ